MFHDLFSSQADESTEKFLRDVSLSLKSQNSHTASNIDGGLYDYSS